MMSDLEKRNRTTGSVSATYPTLVKQVKENSFAILSNNFSHFFSSCDDLFFDLASKAGTNNEQNLFFDAMREVRLKKTQIWNSFKERFESNFKVLTAGRLKAESDARTTQEPVSLESIQLVAKDDMEQDVAITTIVNRARIENQELLYQLNCRFDYLMPDIKVNEQNNPLDPKQIATAVSDALGVLDLDIKCRVILLKHLDRTVITELRNIYSLANELLISAGILPQIRFDVRKNKSGDISPTQPDVTQNTYEQTGNDSQEARINAALSTLTSASRSASAAIGSSTTLGNSGVTLGEVLGLFSQLRENGLSLPNAVSRPAGPSSTPIPQQSLIHSLTDLQLSPDYSQASQTFNIRSVVERILEENQAAGNGDSLKQTDEDIINLVAMFFDFVLDDRNLPVPFQALISRLQIPILKVALNDNEFFSKPDHPARRLINEISNSAVGWDATQDEDQDLLYQRANNSIHHVIEHFTGDVKIFDEALTMFAAASTREKNKAQILEKRTQEAAQGKAKAEHSREETNNVLLTCLKEANLPKKIHDFLTKDWHKVLLYTHLKHGPESAEWLEAKQVVDQVVWAIRTHTDSRSINRLQRIREEILEKISSGLSAINSSQEILSDITLAIHNAFEQVVSGNLAENDLIPLKPEHFVALGQAGVTSGKDWDQLTAVQRQQLKIHAALEEQVNKAKKIKPGTWMYYSPSNSAKTFRCKLAMVTNPGQTYVFVNRFGLRVCDKRLNELAQDLHKGHMKILESGVLFDRAMNNISDRLKKIAS